MDQIIVNAIKPTTPEELFEQLLEHAQLSELPEFMLSTCMSRARSLLDTAADELEGSGFGHVSELIWSAQSAVISADAALQAWRRGNSREDEAYDAAEGGTPA